MGKILTGSAMGEEVSNETEPETEDTMDTATEQETAEETQEPSEIETVKSELSNWQSRYKNLEEVIGRQGKELGELRKIKKQTESTPESEQEFLDKFIKSPKQALEEELGRRESEAGEQQRQAQEFKQNNRNFVYSAVPNMDKLSETILQLAKEDGIENANMEMLNETVISDPMLAIAYAKRALLKQEIESLRSKNGDTLKKIASNSRKTQPLTGTHSANTKEEISRKDVRNLSTEEIRARLKELGQL